MNNFFQESLDYLVRMEYTTGVRQDARKYLADLVEHLADPEIRMQRKQELDQLIREGRIT